MPRYHFHLHECGTVFEDVEGIEREPAELRAVAIRAARDVMCAELAEGRLCLGCCIVVEDAERREVERVHFRDAVSVTGL